jgi:hypothetical protein
MNRRRTTIERAVQIAALLVCSAAASRACADGGAAAVPSCIGIQAPALGNLAAGDRTLGEGVSATAALDANALVPAAGLQLAAFAPAAERAPQAAHETDPATGLRTPASFYMKRRAIRATLEMEAVNLFMTAFGRFFFTEGAEGFIVSTHSIKENLKAGFEWDDNSFSANNYRHPYQGGMYFNAGRANGYDFYQSSMFSFAGAWLWEYTGENHHPAFNDFVNTAVGGIALGEVMYRLSSAVLDNTATGRGRTLREVGGLLINPVRSFNRIFTGEAFAVHANPPDQHPVHADGQFEFGMRTLGDGHLWDASSSKLFMRLEGEYGDPFIKLDHPYDHFDYGVQLNFDNKPYGLGRLVGHGSLIGTEIAHSERAQHLLVAYQDFDYIDNEAYTFGGQSFGAAFVSQYAMGRGYVAHSHLQVNGILLGATKSDYFNISGREYDYGPGLGIKLSAAFSKNGHQVVGLAHESYFVHSVSGTPEQSLVTFTRFRFDVPIRAFFGAGADYTLYTSERNYDELPDVSTHNPELRVYLSWSIQ